MTNDTDIGRDSSRTQARVLGVPRPHATRHRRPTSRQFPLPRLRTLDVENSEPPTPAALGHRGSNTPYPMVAFRASVMSLTAACSDWVTSWSCSR